MRPSGRASSELRAVTLEPGVSKYAEGSCLACFGDTHVLCTASLDESVPRFLRNTGKGWITAEYGMLPGSTNTRKERDRGGKIDGRTTEIQRLIGRSMRAVVDLDALGERSVALDCDVLEADGGTRTLSITGAFIALVDALRTVFPKGDKLPLVDSVAAVSVGIVDGRPMLDLDYHEDVDAAVDMNVVMTGGGRFVEVQGTGEEATFTEAELSAMLQLARGGISDLTAAQQSALGKLWPS